jgi:hypothetical protein
MIMGVGVVVALASAFGKLPYFGMFETRYRAKELIADIQERNFF